jgi:tRNA threonylcarbamoyladenosine biosynthesis protein TsaB
MSGPVIKAPVILAIDTTSEFGSLAIRAAGRLLAERLLNSPEGFGHILFAGLEQLLADASVNLSEIDCFAAAAGPGSFTGVRVGLTAAKGLAEVQHKPVAAVSNLRALATFGSMPRRAVLLDARRGEVYAAVYGEDLDLIQDETVEKLPIWLERLPDEPHEFITIAGSPFRAALEGAPYAAMPWKEAPRALAGAVAFCAEKDLATGRTVDALVADANYVRRSDAELLWKDPRS